MKNTRESLIHEKMMNIHSSLITHNNFHVHHISNVLIQVLRYFMN
jgi:hypothetical protein